MIPMNNAFNRHGWWILPGVSALFFSAAASHAVALIAVAFTNAALECAFVWYVLRKRVRREQAVAAGQLALLVLLEGGSLLFVERMAFALPFIIAVCAVVCFAHYSLRYAQEDAHASLHLVAGDGLRLVAHVAVFSGALIFFASLFYFDLSIAFALLPVIAILFPVVYFDGLLQGNKTTEALFHATAFTLIGFELVAVLLWVPLSYSAAALCVLLAHFLYCEYVIRGLSNEGPHQSDRTLSFMIACSVVVLILLIGTFR